MNYLIKFKQKRELRLLLRYNYKQKINYSSLYQIESFYYIILSTQSILNFRANLQLQLISDKSPVEEYLFNWASAELDQTANYIKFEQDSLLIGNKRVINYLNIPISRTTEPLADIFAVLNYTPDSFSDGGKFNHVDLALEQITKLYNAGARVIDLGVVSTRPLANHVPDATSEIKLLKQILPHVLELKAQLKFELSIDTCYPQTILWLQDFAVDIINDVSGNLPLDIVGTVLNANKRYVAMHSLSIPADPKIVLDEKINPLDYLYNWFENKIETVQNAGYNSSNLILDPGIGFGLNAAQSWFVLRNIDKLREFPCELLIGNSRKSFFKHISMTNAGELDLETAIVSLCIIKQTDYIRLHELELFNRLNQVFKQFG